MEISASLRQQKESHITWQKKVTSTEMTDINASAWSETQQPTQDKKKEM